MALKHAVLAALLNGEYSGYQLTKIFDVGVADFWYAAPQQLDAELTKLEAEGLVTGREVVQRGRPNKRVFKVTDDGLDELTAFAAAPAKPLLLRDELTVKVHAVDLLDPAPVIEQLHERAREAAAKLELFEQMLVRLRGDQDEETFLRQSPHVGPYLSCLAGCRLEREMRDWCLHTARTLTERSANPRRAGRKTT